MTKEEIKKVLDLALEYYKLEIFGTGKESQPPTQERIDYIYDRMQQSLPSNLDEAAFSYENDLWESGFKECGYSPQEVSDAFKAGAKWRDAEIQRCFQAQIEQELKRLEDPSYKGPEKDVEIAAELWALDHIQETEHRDITKAFCAGAEWMAGQGVTVKGLLYGGNIGITDIPEEFYTDKEEEVIVQIRKK